MVSTLFRLALDAVCSHDVSLLLRGDTGIPDHIKLLMMSLLFYDKKRNLLEIEGISDKALFKIFETQHLKCPTCGSLLKDTSDSTELYNYHFNKYPRRKRMRLAINRRKFCEIDNNFVCGKCRAECSCHRHTVLCQSCKSKEEIECKYCNGRCFSSCHEPHHDDYDPSGSDKTFCPHNKYVAPCSNCHTLVDFNCTICNPHGLKNTQCKDCVDEADIDLY